MRLFTKDAKVDALKQVPLFAGLSKKELAEIASASEDIALQPGAVLVREGGLAREFFVLIDGTVEVTKNGKKIDERSGGDFVGEMGLVSDRPRSADVISNGYCHLLALYKKDFRALLAKRPSVRSEIEAVAARRVAENEGKAAS